MFPSRAFSRSWTDVANLCPLCDANMDMVGRSHRCIPKNRPESAKEPALAPKRGRPRIGEPAAKQPWKALGMSERTWYRRQKEKAK